VGETVRYWPNVLDNDVWKPFGISQADLDGKADKVDAVEGHLVVADKDGNLVDADILPGTFVALAFDPDEGMQPHATDIRKVWEAFQSGIPVMLLDNRTNGTGLYASLNAAGYTWPAGDEMAERLTDVDDNYRPYDNSVQGYYFEGKFYDDAAHTTQIEPSDGEVYHDIATDKTYIYGDETFTQVHRFIQFATNELIKDEPAWSSRTSARPVFYRIFEPVGSATANNFDVVYGESTGIIKDDMTKKADKVSNAVQGHFAGLDVSGNLTDSGAKASDFATAAQGRKADTALQEHQDISGKADKSAMDITYVEGDNTKKHIQLKNGLGTDVVTKHQDISGKAEKSEMTVTAGDGVAKVQLKTGLSVDVITDISGKQDVIDDLEDIRSGAAAGATAYQKPGSGIPKSDLVSGVQASLSKADTALQEHQDISGKVDKEEGKGLSTNDFTDEEKSKLDDAFNDRIEAVTQNGTPLDIVNKSVEITETVQTVSVNGIEQPNDGHNIDIGVASLDGSVTVTSGEHGVDLSTTVYKGDAPINVNGDRISLDPSAITKIEETETIHVRQETNLAGNTVFKLDVDTNAGKSYTGESPVQVDNVTNQIGIMKSPLRFEAPIKGTLSPTSLTIGLDYTKAPSLGRIYATVADAVSDSANLSIGEYFETNGFHSSGDGGAARYLVSASGTANGMDIITLANGKLAVLQIGNTVSPEQLGAYGDGTTDDTIILQQAIDYAHDNARVVMLTKAQYRIDSDVFITSNVEIRGRNSRYNYISLRNGACLRIGKTQGASIERITLRDFAINANHTSEYCIVNSDASTSHRDLNFVNTRFVNATIAGVHVKAINLYAIDCYFAQCAVGMHADGEYNYVTRCYYTDNTNDIAVGCARLTIEETTFANQSGSNEVFTILRSANVIANNCFFYGSLASGHYVSKYTRTDYAYQLRFTSCVFDYNAATDPIFTVYTDTQVQRFVTLLFNGCTFKVAAISQIIDNDNAVNSFRLENVDNDIDDTKFLTNTTNRTIYLNVSRTSSKYNECKSGIVLGGKAPDIDLYALTHDGHLMYDATSGVLKLTTGGVRRTIPKSASTTVSKLSSTAALSDVVAKINELITVLADESKIIGY